MVDKAKPTAWLLMAVGDDRQHAGNDGYDDQVDLYYSWDSTVPNATKVAPGDFVAFWDKKRLLGVSVVEAVENSSTLKPRLSCPACGKASFKARKTKTPRFYCFKCRHEFDEPTSQVAPIVQYRSLHDAAWTDLEGLLTGAELRALCTSPKSQLAMRPLDWSLFSSAVVSRGGGRAIERVMGRSPDFAFTSDVGISIEIPGGHTQALVRVRRGQRQFRERLLTRQGGVCAFTGSAPNRVLEAGHLYSYGRLGEHHEHGGLLLRRDIHRLFDDGGLAVDPGSLKIDVDDTLEPYPQYARLHDQRLHVELSDDSTVWLQKHWDEHRLRAPAST